MIQSHWLNEKEVAQATRLSVRSIQRMRGTVTGIPFFRVGGRVWYTEEAVANWIKEKESRLCQQGGNRRQAQKNCANYSITGGITMNYTINTTGTLAILAAWLVSTAVITLIVAYFTGDLK